MKISFIAAGPGAGHAGTIAALPMFKGSDSSSVFTVFDDAANGGLSAATSAADFDGRAGQSISVYGAAGTKTPRIALFGCGKRGDFSSEMFGARCGKAFVIAKHSSLILYLGGIDLTAAEAAQAALGVQLAAYRFQKYRTTLKKSQKPTLKTVKIACDDPAGARKAYKNFYGPVAGGTMLARDLVCEPANKLYPASYAKRIKEMESLGLSVQILGEKRMASLGMHSLLGVGQGSARESQMVIMKWNGGKKNDAPVCLVGKGVTFDTGGISLKPGAGMWDMKGDMGGSAAVVGAMHILAERKAKANVIGIVGLVENMPDGKAQNPGDIVTSMSGQTIEVQNTDAEGRLVLADALYYARTKFKPKAMVNLATLTGAILVALGHEHAGLFSNDDGLAEQLKLAGDASTEYVWRLPLGPKYDKLLDSKYADMKNIGGRLAGSITAGQFLQRFVGDVPWAHLDIAGTAWKGSSSDAREPAWATGFGARLMNRWVADNHEG